MTSLRGMAAEAFIWGSALVAATRLRQNLTRPDDPLVARLPTSGGAALNRLGHQRQLSDPTFDVGVAPNVDTLYSLAWVDLASGPFVLETPDFADRYYTFQLAHADTSCEQSLGQRTHGSQLPPLLIHGPDFEGPLVEGALPTASRTRYFMIAGRLLIRPGDAADAEAVAALQRQVRIRPLASYTADSDEPTPVPQQRVLPTAEDVDDLRLLFLHQLGSVILEGGLTQEERPMVDRFAGLGLSLDRGFTPAALSEDEIVEIAAGLQDGDAAVDRRVSALGTSVNGWSINLQGPRFGSDFRLRAAVARNQIYVVPVEEAVYPLATTSGSGDLLDGRHRYRLELPTPPVSAFWSLTVYRKPGRLVANPIDRYAIGDRTPGLERDPDGGVRVLLQHDPPAPADLANWLPVPDGQFHLLMRLYAPHTDVLQGRWFPPPIEQLDYR